VEHPMVPHFKGRLFALVTRIKFARTNTLAYFVTDEKSFIM